MVANAVDPAGQAHILACMGLTKFAAFMCSILMHFYKNSLLLVQKGFNHKDMLITNQKELDSFCSSLKNAKFIAVDTEFLREKTYYPKLCLIQLSDPKGHAAAIDPLAQGLDLKPVLDLLFDKKILKVFHAARQDLEIFYQMTGQIPHPIFDSQIAAMVCGYGDSIGYDNLVRQLTGGQIDKSSQFTNWSLRPLSEKQVTYALGDVTHLVEVYEALAKELAKTGRTEWVFQEEEILNDPATYDNNPFESWKRIKVRGPKPKTLQILKHLAAWRELKAQNKNIPKSWVFKDETLVDMAHQAPTSIEQLKKIRGVSEDAANGNTGKSLIEEIKKAIDSDPKTWPQVEKLKILPIQAAATVDILKMLLKIESVQHGVASKLIADTEDLELLAMEEHPDIPALKGWRLEVFGQDALALKAGKLSIGLKDGKIVKYKVGDAAELHQKHILH